jgi:hypothetical protein
LTNGFCGSFADNGRKNSDINVSYDCILCVISLLFNYLLFIHFYYIFLSLIYSNFIFVLTFNVINH